jgi:hypothetical protein
MAIEKLLRDALALPREERARLANALQESLETDREEVVGDAIKTIAGSSAEARAAFVVRG